MLSNPWFYATAVPAILITGISKGGFGTGLGIVAVPLMSLAMPTPQAAGIMLPILLVMDAVGLLGYRNRWDRGHMSVMLPAALVGIALGALTFGLVDEAWLKVLIGLIAVAFTLNHWFAPRRGGAAPAQRSVLKGGFWSAVSGYTSFVAHAGGPPISVYLLPLRLDKTLFTGTAVVFFAVVNLVKLLPYGLLGQLNLGNLGAAAVLSPLAPLGMVLGMRLHHRINAVVFYRVCYGLVLLAGAKLLYDGAARLLAG